MTRLYRSGSRDLHTNEAAADGQRLSGYKIGAGFDASLRSGFGILFSGSSQGRILRRVIPRGADGCSAPAIKKEIKTIGSLDLVLFRIL